MASRSSALTGDGVQGFISFTQAAEDSPTVMDGEVKGLGKGKHGLCINVFGDLSKGGESVY